MIPSIAQYSYEMTCCCKILYMYVHIKLKHVICLTVQYIKSFLSSASMGQVYEEHKDDDGFLYIAYSGENTFGLV